MSALLARPIVVDNGTGVIKVLSTVFLSAKTHSFDSHLPQIYSVRNVRLRKKNVELLCNRPVWLAATGRR